MFKDEKEHYNKYKYFVVAVLNLIQIRHNNIPVCLKWFHLMLSLTKHRRRHQNSDSLSIRTRDIGPSDFQGIR